LIHVTDFRSCGVQTSPTKIEGIDSVQGQQQKDKKCAQMLRTYQTLTFDEKNKNMLDYATPKNNCPETPSGHLSAVIDLDTTRPTNNPLSKNIQVSQPSSHKRQPTYLLALLSLLPPKTENLGLVGSPSPLPPLPLPPPTIDLMVSLSIPNCVSQTLAKTP
jgi:hypothetical protein